MRDKQLCITGFSVRWVVLFAPHFAFKLWSTAYCTCFDVFLRSKNLLLTLLLFMCIQMISPTHKTYGLFQWQGTSSYTVNTLLTFIKWQCYSSTDIFKLPMIINKFNYLVQVSITCGNTSTVYKKIALLESRCPKTAFVYLKQTNTSSGHCNNDSKVLTVTDLFELATVQCWGCFSSFIMLKFCLVFLSHSHLSLSTLIYLLEMIASSFGFAGFICCSCLSCLLACWSTK